MDLLSHVLRTVRLEGALFFHGEFREPWCVEVADGASMAEHLRLGASPVAVAHLLLEGSCWIQIDGSDPVLLNTGDVVVLPHGHSHVMGCGPGRTPVSVEHLVGLRTPDLSSIRYGGTGPQAVIACGWFQLERGGTNPLIASLPKLFSTALGSRPSGPWIDGSVRYAARASAAGEPGSDVLVGKVAEALFVEALRGYMDSLDPSQSGWLAGVRDPLVGRCLALLHTEASRAWTIESLAKATHTSRSVLAERFTELVGIPPIQYLRRWRLASAARRLTDESDNLMSIAVDVGYESEAAFNRAFKREFGVSPGAWRRQRPRGETGSLGADGPG